MTMHPKKIENVLTLDAQARCDYFVRKVADFETVWELFDQGWATAQTESSTAVPFWPEEAFAHLCAVDEWTSFRPKAIALDEFMSHWLPGMEKDKRLCVIFPTPQHTGLLVPPLDLLNLLRQELQQYE